MRMISEYIMKQLGRAKYKLLKDGSYFGEISGSKGVWANAKNLEECRRELKSALEDWLVFSLKDGAAIRGLETKVRRHLVKHA